MKLKLRAVRLSFADLYTAVSKFEGDPKFSAMFIIDKESEEGKANLTEFRKIVRELEKERLGGKELPIDKLPIQSGDDKDYTGWAGNIILSSSNKKRPIIIGCKKSAAGVWQPITSENDQFAPYSGCYVNAIVDAWLMDNQYGQRIICSLEAIQFAKDGERFVSSNVNLETDFDELDVEEVSSSVFDL